MSRHPFRTDAKGPKLRWSEVPPPARCLGMVNAANSYLRCYRLGDCSVIVTREWGRWHLSIAHRLRYPTWDELAQARYNAIPPGVWMAMHLPPPKEYVNLHPNCFQIAECDPPQEPPLP